MSLITPSLSFWYDSPTGLGIQILEHDLPKSSEDWIKMSDRELDNISGSYKGGVSNDAKIYHAIMATEAMLKALYWKLEGLTEWPSKSDPNYRFLYKHQLDVLLDKCNRRTKLRTNVELWSSWQTLLNASVKAHRYLPDLPSDEEVNEVAKSARHPDVGVVPWLKRQYHHVI